jgi:hypothetical protein
MERRMHPTSITVIHKYIRREMFDFSQRLFRAEPEHIEALREAFHELRTLLDTHAHQEDTRLIPLLRESAPELGERMRTDHVRLDAQLDQISQMLQSFDPQGSDGVRELLRLHLDWNRFVGSYLLHLDDEERTYFVSLSDRLPPLSAIARSAADNPQADTFLQRLWAVTTCAERAAVEGVEEEASPA